LRCKLFSPRRKWKPRVSLRLNAIVNIKKENSENLSHFSLSPSHSLYIQTMSSSAYDISTLTVVTASSVATSGACSVNAQTCQPVNVLFPNGDSPSRWQSVNGKNPHTPHSPSYSMPPSFFLSYFLSFLLSFFLSFFLSFLLSHSLVVNPDLLSFLPHDFSPLALTCVSLPFHSYSLFNLSNVHPYLLVLLPDLF
jgi:hypothetical protein